MAALLKAEYGADRLRDAVGWDVNQEWVAAKMMGRWQNGQPLIGNPKPPNGPGEPENDFLFGRDDPRGHACPLGAHIRRANPRDSLEPDDPLEQTISKRHLMLRRGRTYFYDAKAKNYPVSSVPGTAERGLLFVAICADLERQFEIVMQSWLGFPSFHGLTGEPDPISTSRSAPGGGRFTIPTSAGPLVLKEMERFVDFRGGGYFFMPSRSALNYLRSLSRPLESRLATLAVEPGRSSGRIVAEGRQKGAPLSALDHLTDNRTDNN
jgi:deferrochelatase/peroxidase EfeB